VGANASASLFLDREHRKRAAGGGAAAVSLHDTVGVTKLGSKSGNSLCQCATFSHRFSDKMRHLLRRPGRFSVGVLR
jgi:hypothetical protein